jgi:acetate kinase
MAVLGGADALAFTGGIGEHDAASRAQIVDALSALGFEIDRAANEAHTKGLRKISAQDSRVAIYMIPAEEDLMIARHVARMCGESRPIAKQSP